MSNLEAFVYCFCALCIAWGVRGMRLVDYFYNVGSNFQKDSSNNEASSGGRAITGLRNPLKEK